MTAPQKSAQRVAIVGGGPVGMALGLALERQGIGAEIFEARTRKAVQQDGRVLALSHGSAQMLDQLGVWVPLQPAATPIRTIHISHRGGLGRTRMRADDLGVEALGYVMPAQALIAALARAIDASEVFYREEAKVGAGETANLLREHALIAWAEGAVDPARAEQRDYGQHALICSATVAGGHANIAWERFTDDGPVALLPLGDAYSVVLACASHRREELLALDDEAFRNLLQRRFGTRLRITGVGARSAYALGLRWRAAVAGERQVWLGNAAQTLHPVAGQGFNLALRDVWQLAQTLAGADALTAPAVLRDYAAQRELDRRGVIGFTDTLIDVFGSDLAPLRHARGAGLLALDLLPPLRNFVARRMMFGARNW